MRPLPFCVRGLGWYKLSPISFEPDNNDRVMEY